VRRFFSDCFRIGRKLLKDQHGWLPAVITGASMLGSALLSKKKQNVSQEPLWTPEQQAAFKDLIGFAKSGEYGGYKAGESYSGALGNYDMTELEKTGQNKLMGLLNSPLSSVQYGDYGQSKLRELFDTDKYDPYSDKGVYGGMKKAILREGSEAQDRLKQNMAMSGGLYSTATGKESGLLQERTTDQLSNTLANLYQNFSNQKVGMIPTALQADQSQAQFGLQRQGQEEDIMQGRIGASQKYGATERILKDQAAKAQYAEWMRANEDKFKRIDALKSIIGTSPEWGTKSMSVPTTSPWSDVLDKISGLAGQWMMNSGGSDSGSSGGGSYMNSNPNLNLDRW
jgi:hypothetical protein